jgi:hypothetical protein
VLCAALWPDRADENCPQSFRETAAQLVQGFVFAAEERFVVDLCHPYSRASSLPCASPTVSSTHQPRSPQLPALPAARLYRRFLQLGCFHRAVLPVGHLADAVVASQPIEERVKLMGETLLIVGSRAEESTFPYRF